MVKFTKFCSEVYLATPIDVVVFNFKCRKHLSDGKSVKSCVIHMTKLINSFCFMCIFVYMYLCIRLSFILHFLIV